MTGTSNDVIIEEKQLVGGNLGDAAKMFLAETMRELSMKQLKTGHFGYGQFEHEVKQVCVEAFYEKEREEFFGSNKSAAFLMKVREIMDKLPDWMNRADKVQHARLSVLSHLENKLGDGVAEWITDPFYPYNPDDFELCKGNSVPIEDLQMAVIQLSRKAESAAPPGRGDMKSFLKKTGSRMLGEVPQQGFMDSCGSVKNQGDLSDLRDAGSDLDSPTNLSQRPPSAGSSLPGEVVHTKLDRPLSGALRSNGDKSSCEQVADEIASTSQEVEALQKEMQEKQEQLFRLQRQFELEDGESEAEEWS